MSDPFDFANLTGSDSIDNLIEQSSIARGNNLQSKFREKQVKIFNDQEQARRLKELQNGTATFEPTLDERRQAAAEGLNVMRDVNGLWGTYPERPDIIEQDLNNFVVELENRFIKGEPTPQEKPRYDPLNSSQTQVDKIDQGYLGSLQDGVANAAEIGSLALSPQVATAAWNVPSIIGNFLYNAVGETGLYDSRDPIRLTQLNDYADEDSNPFGHMLYTAQKELEASADTLRKGIAQDPDIYRKEYNEVVSTTYQKALANHEGDILKSILSTVGAVVAERPDAALQVALESLPSMLMNASPAGAGAYIAGAYTKNFAETRDAITKEKGEMTNDDVLSATLAAVTAAVADTLGDRLVANKAFSLGAKTDLTATLSERLASVGFRAGQAATGEAIAEGSSEAIQQAAQQDKFLDGSFLTDRDILEQAGESAVLGALGSIGSTAPSNVSEVASIAKESVQTAAPERRPKQSKPVETEGYKLDTDEGNVTVISEMFPDFKENVDKYTALRKKVSFKTPEEANQHVDDLITSYGKVAAQAYKFDPDGVAQDNLNKRIQELTTQLNVVGKNNPDAVIPKGEDFVKRFEAAFVLDDTTETETATEEVSDVTDEVATEVSEDTIESLVSEADNSVPDVTDTIAASVKGAELETATADSFTKEAIDTRDKAARQQTNRVFADKAESVTTTEESTPNSNALGSKGEGTQTKPTSTNDQTAKAKAENLTKVTDNTLRNTMRQEYKNALVHSQEAEISQSPSTMKKLASSLVKRASSDDLKGTDIGKYFTDLAKDIRTKADNIELDGREVTNKTINRIKKNVSDLDKRLNGKTIQTAGVNQTPNVTEQVKLTNTEELFYAARTTDDPSILTEEQIRKVTRADAVNAIREAGVTTEQIRTKQLTAQQARNVTNKLREVKAQAQELLANFNDEELTAFEAGTANLDKYIDDVANYVAEESVVFAAQGTSKSERQQSLITGFNPRVGKLKLNRSTDSNASIETDAGKWFTLKGVTSHVKSSVSKLKDSQKERYTDELVEQTSKNLNDIVSVFSGTLRNSFNEILPVKRGNVTYNTKGYTNLGQTHEIRDLLTYNSESDRNLDLDENIVAAMAVATLNAVDGLGTFNDDRSIGYIFGTDFDSALATKEMLEVARKYRDGRVNRAFLADSIGKAVIQSLGITYDKDLAPNNFKENLAEAIGLTGIAVAEELGWIETQSVNAYEFGQDKAVIDSFSDDNTTSTPDASVNFVRVIRDDQNVISESVQTYKDKLKVTDSDERSIYSVAQVFDMPHRLRGLSTKPFEQNAIRENVAKGTRLPREAVEAAQEAISNPYVMNEGLLHYLESNDDLTVVRAVGGFDDSLTDLSPEGLEAWATANFHKNQKDSAIYSVEGVMESVRRAREAVEIIRSEGWESGKPVYFNFAIFQQTRFGIDSNTLNPQADKFHRMLVIPKTSNGRKMGGKDFIENIREDGLPVSLQGLAYAFGEFDEKASDLTRAQAVENLRDYVEAADLSAVHEFVEYYETTGSISDNLLAAANEQLASISTVFGGTVKAKGLAGTLALQDLVNYRRALKNPEYSFESNQVIEIDGLTNGFAITMMQAPITDDIVSDLNNTGSYADTDMTVGKHFDRPDASDSYQNIAKLINRNLPVALQKVIARALAQTKGKKVKHRNLLVRSKELLKENKQSTKELANHSIKAIEAVQGALELDGKVTKAARDMVKNPFMIVNYAASLATVKRTAKAAFVRQLDTKFASFNEISDQFERLAEVRKFTAIMRDAGILVDANALATDPLNYELDKANQELVNDVLAEALGQAMIEGIDARLGKLNRYRNMLNSTFHLQFEVFSLAMDNYAKQKGYKKNKGGNYEMTAAQADQMISDLKGLLPSFKGAFEDTYESDRVIPLFDLVKLTNTEDPTGKVSVDFGFNVRKESTITGRSTRKELSPVGVGGAAAMTQAFDAYTMLMLAREFPDVLHVHDAVKATAEQAPEVAYRLNEIFVEGSLKYSMMDDAIGSMFSHIEQADNMNLLSFEVKDVKELTPHQKKEWVLAAKLAKQKGESLPERKSRTVGFRDMDLGTFFSQLIAARKEREALAGNDYEYFSPKLEADNFDLITQDEVFMSLDTNTQNKLKSKPNKGAVLEALSGYLYLNELFGLKEQIDQSRVEVLGQMTSNGQYTSPIVRGVQTGHYKKPEGFKPVIRDLKSLAPVSQEFLDLLDKSALVKESVAVMPANVIESVELTAKEKSKLVDLRKRMNQLISREQQGEIAVATAELETGTPKVDSVPPTTRKKLNAIKRRIKDIRSNNNRLNSSPNEENGLDNFLDSLTGHSATSIVDADTLRSTAALVGSMDTITSDAHKARLDNVVSTLISSGLSYVGELKVRIAQKSGSNFGAIRDNNVYVLSGTESSPINQGEYEILVHELVHSIGRLVGTKGYEKFHARINEIKSDLIKAVNDNEALAELFIPRNQDGSLNFNGNEQAVRAEARKLRDYVFFNNARVEGLATTQSTQEFIAYALTNPVFMENINQYTTQQNRGRPVLLGDSIAVRLLNTLWNILQRAFDAVTNERQGSQVKSIDQATYDVMMDMTAAMQRSARKSRFAVFKRLEANVFKSARKGNELTGKHLRRAAERTRKGLSKAFGSSDNGNFSLSPKAQETLTKMLIAKEFVTGEPETNVTSRVQKIAFESTSGNDFIRKLREEFGMGSESSVANILESITQEGGKLEGYFTTHRKFKSEVDRASSVEESAIKHKVREDFLEPLMDNESTGITDALLRTDFSSVYDYVGNDVSRVRKLLSDSREVDTLAANILEEIQGSTPKEVFNAMYLQMDALAKYMVDNKNHMGNQIRNVDNLIKGSAFMFQENNSNRNSFIGSFRQHMTKYNDPAERSKLEAWVSLRALQLTPDETKGSIQKVVQREFGRDTGNGIISVIEMQNALKEYSKDQTFEGSEFLMLKGYIPSMYDVHHDFHLARVADRKRLAREGYEPANEDMSNLHSTDSVLYVRRGMSGSEMVSGPLNTNLLHARGTDLKDIINADVSSPSDLAVMRERITKRNNDYSNALVDAALGNRFAIPVQDKGVPVFNKDGYVTSLQYLMPEDRQVALLKKRKPVDEVLGRAFGTVTRRVNSPVMSSQAFDAVYEDYAENYDSNPNDFVWISPNDFDELGVPNVYKDEYRKMPEELQARAAMLYGGRGIPVRKGMIRMMFGGRKMSLTNSAPIKYLQAQYPNTPVTYWTGAVENIWKEVVQLAKVGIVIKTPAVFAFNVLSNFVLTSMKGVPVSDSIKWHIEGIREVNRYKEWEDQLSRVRVDLQSRDAFKVKKAQAKYDDLLRQMENSPVRKLFEEGVYQTITEDITLDKHGYLDSAKDWVANRTGLRSSKAEVVLDWVFLNSNTPLFKLMNRATQISDFTSRYALYRHEMRENSKLPANKQRSEKTILNEIMEDLVNYDIPDPKGLEYANNMGLVMFTKYFLGVQRVIQRLIKRNALTTSGVVGGQLMLGDIEDTLDNSILMKDWSRLFKTPADILEAATEPYGLNLILK